MPTTTRRHTLTLAGLEVPVVEVTGAGDGPRLVVLAGVHGCEYASSPGRRAHRHGRALEPFALYDGPAEARARELASAYGLGYVIRQEPGPDRAVGGSTSAAAAAAGIPAIIAEAGGCGLVERAAVDAHVRGLDRILAALGITGPPQGSSQAEAGPAQEPAYLRRFLWLRCQDEGWWEPAVSPGETVAEGQLLGTVSSLDGARLLQTITAPAAGVPMFITSSPAVAADGLLLGLGAA